MNADLAIEDQQGAPVRISRAALLERIVAFETTRMLETASTGDTTEIAQMLRVGAIGFNEGTDDDLLIRWKAISDEFYQLEAANLLQAELHEDDPVFIPAVLHQLRT